MLAEDELGRAAPLLEAAWLGRVSYRPAWDLQEELRRRLLAARDAGSLDGEMLLLLEHAPVITLGRSGDARNVLLSAEEAAARGIEVVRSSRGGDVTLHAPGQLVAYPVVRLDRGVEAHVAGMAAAVIDVARALGIDAEYRRRTPGVWVGDRKLCAFGVQVHRRVAIHGLALNVSTRLEDFASIVPCGLRDVGVTSIAELTQVDHALPEVATALAASLAHHLGRTLRYLGERPIDSLLSRSSLVR